MISAVALLKRVHQHRAWVNKNLLAAAAAVDDEQLHRSFAIGQGSIWKSLLHMYAAEFVWLEALLGNETAFVPGDLPGRLPGNQMGEGGIRSLADLQDKWTELQTRWDSYLAGLSSEALDENVYRVSTSSGFGQRVATKRCDVLLHVCTHAQYTTAQVVNMLRQAGVSQLPDSMLITLARHEAAAAPS